MRLAGPELIRRYKANYGLTPETQITEEMIRRHWELESRLRSDLLRSDPAARHEVFERAYTALYSEVSWLNRALEGAAAHTESALLELWLHVIGPPPGKVYEIGSGQGALIRYLAARGFTCRGSEITRERGGRATSAAGNLSWGTSDGVHLERFEPRDHYDVVISDQVVEHLHPEDLADHFRGVFSIVAPGGRYVLGTPHVYAGPADVSAVFGYSSPAGMHLKEYTYRQLVQQLEAAGFADCRTVLRLPARLRRSRLVHRLGIRVPAPVTSRLYLQYLMSLERIIGILPTAGARRAVSRSLRFALFAPNIMLVGTKPPTEPRADPR